MIKRALQAAICIIAFASCTANAMPANEYRIIDFGEDISLYNINNKNQTVGDVKVGNTHEACIWDSVNGARPLGTLGGEYSYAVDINDSGQVVGYSEIETGEERIFIWDQENGMRPWEHSNFPKGCHIEGINNSGQITGFTDDNKVLIWCGDDQAYTLGSECLIYNTLNNKGQIVGHCYRNGPTNFIWDSTNGIQYIFPYDFSTLMCDARDINDNGQIAGTWFDEKRAFVWDSINGMTLFNAPDGKHIIANSINNNGDVVGCFGPYFLETPYIWNRETGMQILPQPENTETVPWHINDNGWIIGISDSGHSIIWEPVPEPTSLIGLGVGVTSLLCLLKKRAILVGKGEDA